MGRSYLLLGFTLFTSCWYSDIPDKNQTFIVTVAAYDGPITSKRYVELEDTIKREFKRNKLDVQIRLVLADTISEAAADTVAFAVTQSSPDVAIAWSTGMAIAFRKLGRQQTVFTSRGDPLAYKIIDSWERPNGNITGVFVGDLAHHKRLELLVELLPVPTKRNVAAIADKDWIIDAKRLDFIDSTAKRFGVNLTYVEVKSASDLLELRKDATKYDGYYIPISLSTVEFGKDLMNTLNDSGQSVIVASKELFAMGGNAAYYFDEELIDQQVATLVRRIAMGELASDVPVELPGQYRFALRLSKKNGEPHQLSKRLLYFADIVTHQ
jgi:ABC-type uncharacterized transport system substrate-binding protein